MPPNWRQLYGLAGVTIAPAAIYVGEMYIVLNATEHIRSLTRHFDNLIRNAVVGPSESAAFLRELKVA